MIGISPLPTAKEVFGLFDSTKGGILHIQDLAAGLAILCDGCTARSALRTCGLYTGSDGNMGFREICGFTTSIFKVKYACRVFKVAPLQQWHL